MRLILAFSAVAAAICGARSHEPYGTLRHPITKDLCCNGEDCAWIAPERVKAVVGGYDVVHVSGKRSFMPYREALPSWDGQYHACFWPNPETLRCLVAPIPGG